MSLDKIQTNLPSQHQLRQQSLPVVSFNLSPRIDFDDLGFNRLEVSIRIEPRMFETFEWSMLGISNENKALELQIQYNSDLFSSTAIKSWFAGFERFLTELIDDLDGKIDEFQI